MKRIINKFSILIIALVFSIGAISACSSASKTNAEDTGAAGGSEQSTAVANNKANAENKTAENKTSNEPAKETQADGLPELKKGEDYKTVVRGKMLKSGWKPARSENADWCGSRELVCDYFEEYEGGTKKYVSFRWQKGSKFVEILTVGESLAPDSGYTYDHYEVEKDSQTVVQHERWNEFWNDFKTAINKKDKEKLKYMMTEKIDGGGAVETAEERLAAIEESDMWSSMQKTVAEGTKIDKCDKPCRVSKDGYLVFTYERADWKWSGLGGEGGEN